MYIIDEFETQLEKDVRDDNIHGSISAAVVGGDQILWAKAFGHLSTEGDRLADVNTIYRIGSVAKPFTAFLMMLLVQEGLIDLDGPVQTHLPEIRGLEGYSDSTRFTFRQLASHTAGLVREPKLEHAASGPLEGWEEKVLQSIHHTSFESKPGERFSYSNIGYGILGVALSRAAGLPFMEMIEARIFEPLTMQNSFFLIPSENRDQLAQGIGGGPFAYEGIDMQGPEKEHLGRGYKVPNGGLYSTPGDLAKFMIANLGYTDLLEKNYIESMHTKHTPEASHYGYGLGFELYQDNSISLVEHSGGVLGYSAYFGFEKKSRKGLILMRNYNWGATNWEMDPRILLRKLRGQT